MPFATAWLGENPRATAPVAIYGVILISAGIAYYILTQSLIRHHGKDSPLASSIGKDRKGAISIAIYAIAISLAFAWPGASCACYVLVALIWLVPDPRIERHME